MAEQCAVYIKKLSVTQKKKKTKLPYCKWRQEKQQM
jgi:hypothetical protein